MYLFDSHTHLQDEKIINNIDSIIKSARLVGVTKIHICGTNENDWKNVIELQNKFEGTIIPSFGIHPWFINDISKNWLSNLKETISKYNAGIGEIGLDHAIEDRDDSLQEEVFTKQLELAIDKKLPVTVHSRRAWNRMIPVLEKYFTDPKTRVPFMIHSFSGSLDMIPKLIDLGCYFSFSGTLTFSRNKKAYNNIKAIPLDRLLIETDSPYLPPIIANKKDLKINEPANIIYVLEKAAELTGESTDSLAQITFENAYNFFGHLMEG